MLFYGECHVVLCRKNFFKEKEDLMTIPERVRSSKEWCEELFWRWKDMEKWLGWLKQQISLKGRILVRFLNVISPINEGVPLPD